MGWLVCAIMDKEIEWIVEFKNVAGDYRHILEWLVDKIEDVGERHTIGEFAGKPKPYHFSSIGQFARYRGETSQWHLEIQGNSQVNIVKFNETVSLRIITEFALKHQCQAK
jgi:hypothetical protein